MPPQTSLERHIFRTLSDNCGALIRDRATGLCAAVDAPEAAPILDAARQTGWTISHLFITHEHADHVQGAAALKAATGCTVIGPAQAASGAPVDRIVGEGDDVSLGETAFKIWATPGHSPGHVTWVSTAAKLALVGDVVFVMGCGRLSGDTARQLWQSVSRIAALDDDVTLITGHDYTFGNARFALAMEPENAAIIARTAEAERRAASRDFWAVTQVGDEKATNPFFRATNPAMMTRLDRNDPGSAFARLRELKNTFKG